MQCPSLEFGGKGLPGPQIAVIAQTIVCCRAGVELTRSEWKIHSDKDESHAIIYFSTFQSTADVHILINPLHAKIAHLGHFPVSVIGYLVLRTCDHMLSHARNLLFHMLINRSRVREQSL